MNTIFETCSAEDGKYHVILNDVDTELTFAQYSILVGSDDLNTKTTAIQYYLIYDDNMENLQEYFLPQDPRFSLEAVYYDLQKFITNKYMKAIKHLNYYDYQLYKNRFPLALGALFLDATFIGETIAETVLRIVDQFASDGIIIGNIVIYNADLLDESKAVSNVLKHYLANVILINSEDMCGPILVRTKLFQKLDCFLNELFKPPCYPLLNGPKMSDHYKDSIFTEMGKNGITYGANNIKCSVCDKN